MINISLLLITFSSATTATRIKNELTKNKFSAMVIQTPKNLTKSGCSYSIKTTENALPAAEKTADRLGVKIKSVFRQDGKEYVEYR